jgi:outer membrane protein assembly factor BamB
VVYEGFDAFDAFNGRLLWAAPLLSVYSTAAVANGVVYLGAENSNIYAFNAATGQTLWTAATDYPVESGLVVANGILYAASPDTLYAFGLPAAAPPAPPDPATLKPGPHLAP